MQSIESAFDTSDLDASGIDQQRLNFVQRQRVMAFLADSARYLGLWCAADERRRDRCCAGVATALEDAQLTAGVRGC